MKKTLFLLMLVVVTVTTQSQDSVHIAKNVLATLSHHPKDIDDHAALVLMQHPGETAMITKNGALACSGVPILPFIGGGWHRPYSNFILSYAHAGWKTIELQGTEEGSNINGFAGVYAFVFIVSFLMRYGGIAIIYKIAYKKKRKNKPDYWMQYHDLQDYRNYPFYLMWENIFGLIFIIVFLVLRSRGELTTTAMLVFQWWVVVLMILPAMLSKRYAAKCINKLDTVKANVFAPSA